MKLDKNKENQSEKNYNLIKENIFWKRFKLIMTILLSISIIFTILCIWDARRPRITDAMKPIIYIYPEEKTEISVELEYPEKITCSYPAYVDGWNVIASPDGTLIDTDTQRTLYSLYWEGKGFINKTNNEGFVVEGKDTIKFLEEKLEILGLSEKETEEFIIYWLPKMQKNKYNYIRFATIDEINEYMPLNFSKKPDNLIRVYMQFKALNRPINVTPQKLETPSRSGFVIVEWGGTEIH